MPVPHAEVEVTPAMVRSLLRAQHPHLADLPIEPAATGWDNVMFRLGEELAVRLPRRALGVPLLLHEQRWLPAIAPGLPLEVPAPVLAGAPGCGYPWPWSVCRWVPGAEVEVSPPGDWADLARGLGAFLAALQRPAPGDAPRNPYRGVPLEDRAEALHAGIAVLSDRERRAVVARWDELVATPAWPGPPVWLHGDLHPRNLVVRDGRLVGVVDFGDVTAGDPATDLSVAWILLPPEHRRTFRAAAGYLADDETWARARGWALALAVAYLGGDERIARIGRRTLAAVLADPT